MLEALEIKPVHEVCIVKCFGECHAFNLVVMVNLCDYYTSNGSDCQSHIVKLCIFSKKVLYNY